MLSLLKNDSLLTSSSACLSHSPLSIPPGSPWACLAVASLGNWLGSLTTFGLGWLGRWDWIEKWFNVDREKLEKQKARIDKYGVWLALLVWLPFVGDIFTIGLGFYKTKPVLTAFLLLVGRTLRFLVWNLLLGAY